MKSRAIELAGRELAAFRLGPRIFDVGRQSSGAMNIAADRRRRLLIYRRDTKQMPCIRPAARIVVLASLAVDKIDSLLGRRMQLAARPLPDPEFHSTATARHHREPRAIG